MDLSIIVPCFNSEESLDELGKRLQMQLESLRIEGEVIFIDDGSVDSTWLEILNLSFKHSNFIGIQFARNFGQHKAIHAGLARSSGNWAIVMDADLQDSPEAIADLYLQATENNDDAVIVKRIGKSTNSINRATSRLFRLALYGYSNIKIPEKTGNFGIYSRKLVSQILSFTDQEFLFPALVQACHPTVSYLEVPRDLRKLGKTSYTLRSRIRLAATTFLWNSNGVLKLSLQVGLASTAFGLTFGLVLIIDRLTGNLVIPGWTSVIVTLVFSNGLTLSMLGALGMYIGKIFDYNKSRPLYVIRKSTEIRES